MCSFSIYWMFIFTCLHKQIGRWKTQMLCHLSLISLENWKNVCSIIECLSFVLWLKCLLTIFVPSTRWVNYRQKIFFAWMTVICLYMSWKWVQFKAINDPTFSRTHSYDHINKRQLLTWSDDQTQLRIIAFHFHQNKSGNS